MTEVRCPRCNKLLGYFDGRGEMICPRCRKDAKIHFDTRQKPVQIHI